MGASITLRPNADGTTIEWTPTPSERAHFNTVNDPVPFPDLTDHISTTVFGENEVHDVEDAPPDYDTSNTVQLRVHGETGSVLGFLVSLRTGNSVLVTLAFEAGVGPETRDAGPVLVDLSLAEINDLNLLYQSNIGGAGGTVFAYAVEIILDYNRTVGVIGGRILPMVPMLSYITAAWGDLLLIQEEGTDLPQQPTLNFIGGDVTAADDAANDRTNVTVDPIPDVKSGKELNVADDSTQAVTFTTAFTNTPHVVVCGAEQVNADDFFRAFNESTTGFTIHIRKGHGGAGHTWDVFWIATDAGDP